MHTLARLNYFLQEFVAIVKLQYSRFSNQEYETDLYSGKLMISTASFNGNILKFVANFSIKVPIQWFI